MSKYITTDFFKIHSRITVDDEAYLQQCLDAAEDTLRCDLQIETLSFLAENGKLPASLTQALLMLAGTNYENREAEAPVQMYADPHYRHLIQPYIRYKGCAQDF